MRLTGPGLFPQLMAFRTELLQDADDQPAVCSEIRWSSQELSEGLSYSMRVSRPSDERWTPTSNSYLFRRSVRIHFEELGMPATPMRCRFLTPMALLLASCLVFPRRLSHKKARGSTSIPIRTNDGRNGSSGGTRRITSGPPADLSKVYAATRMGRPLSQLRPGRHLVKIESFALPPRGTSRSILQQ